VLRDGSTLAVRPIRPDDEADLARFFTDLSTESRIIPTPHEQAISLTLDWFRSH